MTGHFRFGETVNRRVQDGLKTYLLCYDCENRFGAWENALAQKIFMPLHEDRIMSTYGSWLVKFCTSLSWRILTYFKDSLDLKHFSAEMLRSADDALDVWRDFLLDKRPTPDKCEQHMLPFRGFIADRSDPELPSNFNRYVSRSVDIDAACSESQAYIYAKMCRILVIGFIQMSHRERWRDTRVHVKHGTLEKKHYSIPIDVRNFMYYKARKAQKISRIMSTRQWNKVGKDYERNLDKFPTSEMFRAVTHDFILFGNDAFDDK